MTSTGHTLNHAALLSRLGGDVNADPIAVSYDGRVLEIGKFGGIPVWSADLRPSECSALARRFAKKGQLGLLLCVDSEQRRRLLVVTVAPIRITAIALDDLDALVLRRLARVAQLPVENTLQQAIRCADALDVDAAGRKTFKLLHQLLEDGIEHLAGRVSRADRHAWLLTQLTRLLFLRFVEAEGWLNNDPKFLLNHFDRELNRKRDPFKYFLQPLFFGTLNRPSDERLRVAREFGAIPFLNGGLFEPHSIEERHEFVLPSSYWENVFGAIAERIDVTLDPTAEGGEVTPEMLGRVFEGVMDIKERKTNGAFYTPAPLVRALVKEALVALLAKRTGQEESELDLALESPDIELRRMLLTIRVLDPAVGSGAFLVGALDLLHGPGPREPGRVRHLVTRSLHGIDRHPGAVRITELRLWLEVLRALRGATPQQVPPLPNLDATIRAGDALLDSLHGAPSTSATAVLLGKQQRALANSHGKTKRAILFAIRKSERENLLEQLGDCEARLKRSIEELVEIGQTQTLFGDAAGLSSNERRRVTGLKQEWLEIRRESRAVQRDTSAVPFACSVAFGPLFARQGGFDLVVGNPPWVRAERLPTTTRRALSARYRWWRGESARGFQHQPDLAVAFTERAVELLRPGGTLAFLLPAKLATTRYAAVMRESLTRQTTVHCVADLSKDPRAYFHATTYPMAFIATRSPRPADHEIRLSLQNPAPRVAQRYWDSATSWAINSPMAKQVAQRLAKDFPSLRETIAPQLGIKTGANDLFLNPPATVSEWTRPTIRGRDVAKGEAAMLDRLLWPADERGNPWKRLPTAVAEYLAPHHARLQRRTDLHDGVWWRLFRTTAATAPYRVIWSDLARRLEAMSLEDACIVPLNSCYVASVKSAATARALSRWLNCVWIRSLARLNADPAAQGYSRFNARAVGDLPFPPTVLEDPFFNALAEDGEFHHRETELDEIAAEHLQLSQSDRETLGALAPNRR